MKKTFTLAFFLVFTFTSYCQTYVSGFINANTTWNLAGAPYIVTGNTLVSNGYTLTVDPGVIVKFDLNTALQVDGELIAIGSAVKRIIFTSNQATPAAGDWGKLHIGDNSVDAVYDSQGNYLSGTILKYCDVLYGGGVSFGALHIVSASPYISQCTIQHSLASGIYCAGSSYILDSSLVNDCFQYGMYFDQITLNSCGLIVRTDTIENNKQGGLYVASLVGCTTTIENNYFISNAVKGGLFFNSNASNATVSKNYFLSNTGYGAIFFAGIVDTRLSENYFLGNRTDGNNNNIGTVTFYSFANVTVVENFFKNDTVKQGRQAGILEMRVGQSAMNDTVECNTFLNNETEGSDYGVLYFNASQNGRTELIRNNIIDGNVNIAASGYSGVYIVSGNYDTLEFSTNTIKNNSAPLGTCCYFKPNLVNNNRLMHIDHNEFTNNTAKNIIYLDGTLTNNSNYNFLYMKHNNFLDATNNIELYDKIPYGSPNVIADSNYWGSTSTQHIDSIIYDYFDTANYSVVYYLPILEFPEEIDTSCTLGIPTAVAAKRNDEPSLLYPNPFSSYSEIEFNRELKDASLLVYNVFGQKVKQTEHIYGRHLRIERGNLPEGIYLYNVPEGQYNTQGKFIIE